MLGIYLLWPNLLTTIREKYGLYINSDLIRGYSYPSETFDNCILSSDVDFEILKIEVEFIVLFSLFKRFGLYQRKQMIKIFIVEMFISTIKRT